MFGQKYPILIGILIYVFYCTLAEADGEVFTYKREIPVPLSKFCNLIIKAPSFQEEYLKLSNREDLWIGEWIKDGQYSIRQMNFTQKVATPPGIPSEVETVSSQKYTLVPGKELKMTEHFSFSGFVVSCFELDTEWIVESNDSGIRVEAVTSINFKPGSTFIPGFVRKIISLSIARDLEKTMSIWSRMVENVANKSPENKVRQLFERVLLI